MPQENDRELKAPIMPEGLITKPKFKLYANVFWTPTYIHVEPGLTFLVASFLKTEAGQIGWNTRSGAGLFGGDGDPSRKGSAQAILPNYNEALLVGKIGEEGEAFPIGSFGRIPSIQAGQLFLSANDNKDGVDYDGNEGAIWIEIYLPGK